LIFSSGAIIEQVYSALLIDDLQDELVRLESEKLNKD
jgi:hypothetical protein